MAVTGATTRLRQLRAGLSSPFLVTCLSDLGDIRGRLSCRLKNGLPTQIVQ